MEIDSLRKELQKYKPPSIQCRCETEWESKIERSLRNIRYELNSIMEDEEEYEWMETDGLTRRQLNLLEQKLKDELYVLTNNSIWSDYEGKRMITQIHQNIKTLVDCEYWALMHGVSTKQDILNYMCGLIVKIYRSIAEKLVVYCCQDCEVKTHMAFEDNEQKMFCTDCAEKHGVELWI